MEVIKKMRKKEQLDNSKELIEALDQLEEKRDEAELRIAAH